MLTLPCTSPFSAVPMNSCRSYGMYGIVRERHGPNHNEFECPPQSFPTKDGKWVAIACATDKLFARLAMSMERPELASSSTYGEQKTRLENCHDVERDCERLVWVLDSRGGT